LGYQGPVFAPKELTEEDKLSNFGEILKLTPIWSMIEEIRKGDIPNLNVLDYPTGFEDLQDSFQKEE